MKIISTYSEFYTLDKSTAEYSDTSYVICMINYLLCMIPSSISKALFVDEFYVSQKNGLNLMNFI